MIVIGSTLAPYKAVPYTNRFGRMVDESAMWLENAEAITANSPQEVSWFAALEVDARGIAPYQERLTQRLHDVNGASWTFSLDTGAHRMDSAERLIHICEGRNLVTEYAMRYGAEWVLYLDSDLRIPDDSIPKLLELDWPIVGGEVPEYCLTGREVTERPDDRAFLDHWGDRPGPAQPYDFPVQAHWNTAGFLLVHRDLFSKLRWRHETPGLTDDPCYGEDARRLGFETLVRKDLTGDHDMLVPVEERGHDLAVQR